MIFQCARASIRSFVHAYTYNFTPSLSSFHFSEQKKGMAAAAAAANVHFELRCIQANGWCGCESIIATESVQRAIGQLCIDQLLEGEDPDHELYIRLNSNHAAWVLVVAYGPGDEHSIVACMRTRMRGNAMCQSLIRVSSDAENHREEFVHMLTTSIIAMSAIGVGTYTYAVSDENNEIMNRHELFAGKLVNDGTAPSMAAFTGVFRKFKISELRALWSPVSGPFSKHERHFWGEWIDMQFMNASIFIHVSIDSIVHPDSIHPEYIATL